MFESKPPIFTVSLGTHEAPIYRETLPWPISAPLIGQDIHVGGHQHGWWRVTSICWYYPNQGAQTPTLELSILVEWSPSNGREEPRYDEDAGWIAQDAE